MTETNWAGNYTYRARQVHRPTTLEQVQHLVASAHRVRVLGSRHSFNDIADSTELISLSGLPADLRVDREAGTVSFGAGLSYAALAQELDNHHLALHNLASLPHLSVAGAVATATHGSGDRSGNLATAVAGLELITSNGELLRIARGSPGFDGVVVGLGAVGAVARVTLDVEPAYQVRQRVFERLSWGALFDHFDQITSSGDSVSLFTDWGPTVDQVWVKTRVRSDAAESPDADFFGAIAATVDRHPIAGMDPVNCTPQLGRPGSWWERLPHFRIGFTPSSGDELQSEYLVPRQHALSAIDALRRMADRIRLLLQVSEIRTVAADQLWMSPQYGRDTVGIHFTWLPRPREVERLLGEIESVLARFEARPHWGKLFLATAGDIAALYERLPDFLRLVEQLDPRGAFRNAWFDARLRGTA